MSVITTERDAAADRSERTKVRAIDVDGHFYEPPQMWDEYLPAKFQGFGPRRIVDSLGRNRLVVAGKALPAIPSSRRHSDATRGGVEAAGSDPQARLAIMDSEGVEAMFMYPTTGLQFGAVDDLEVLVALCQAYNNWAHDFCSVAPDRLFAPALVPQVSIRETVVEIERAVGELGMRGVFMRPNPIGRTLEDPAWEPVWSLLEELDAPLGLHEGTGLNVPQLGVDRTENFLFKHMMTHAFEHMTAMMMLIGGGALDRHPGMKVLFLEAGCGWVPYWLERLEHHVDEWAYPGMELELRPTDYFKRQCLVSTDSDEGAVIPAFVACLGADNLCWSTDFPHPDHEWRGMVGTFIDRTDLDDESKRKIIGENTARVYKL
jgi:predicted TIM-barrel fold metal-dependent hydrolase